MLTPPDRDCRVIHADPALPDGADVWAALGQDAWLDRADTLKHNQHRHSSVLAGPPPGPIAEPLARLGIARIVVKTEPTATGPRRLAQRLGLGRSTLARQRRGTESLRVRHIPTARILAHIAGTHSRSNRRVESLVIEYIDAPTLLQLAHSPPDDPVRAHQIARAAGHLTATILTRGLLNRDHKPSNILVTNPDPDPDPDPDTNAPPRLILIDTVGVRPIQRPRPSPDRPPAHLCRMLFNLDVECVGTNAPVTRTQRLRVLTAAHDALHPPDSRERASLNPRLWCRQAWRDIQTRLDQHGDPTPKDPPNSQFISSI